MGVSFFKSSDGGGTDSECEKSSQASGERGCDEKIGERRAVHKPALRNLHSRVFS
jgi:hypothetical protein